jgi:hypothetical protein
VYKRTGSHNLLQGIQPLRGQCQLGGHLPYRPHPRPRPEQQQPREQLRIQFMERVLVVGVVFGDGAHNWGSGKDRARALHRPGTGVNSDRRRRRGGCARHPGAN